MALESKAVFAARLVKLGLADKSEDFVRLGWGTLGLFAYATNYVPGRADDTNFVTDILFPLFGENNPTEKAAVRRLFYEAYSMSAAEVVRMSTQVDEEEKPKKLPAPERADRFDTLKAKLSGLKLKGELEPSNALVDKVVHMNDIGELRYVKWEELTKKDQEMNGEKKVPGYVEDTDGRLKKVYRDGVETKADLKDLLMLKYALQRRGLAFELGRLMSFEAHEKLVNFLFEELSQDPLPGHASVSLDQVRRADKHVFGRLGEMTRAGFQIMPEGEYLLDKLLEVVLVEPKLAQMLFQIQSGRRPNSDDTGADNKRNNDGEVARLREEVKRLKSSAGGAWKSAGGGKDRNGKGKGGKGKGLGKDKGNNMPKELIGMCKWQEGKAVCFDYNMRKRCPTKGERCTLGEHICALPGCGGRHSLQDCRRRKE